MHDDCYGLLRRVAPHRAGRNMGPKAHVLVCAPSNSALDEIVMRWVDNRGEGGLVWASPAIA